MTAALRIAELGADDLGPVHELEQACHVAPWSRSMLADELVRPDGIRVGIWQEDDATLAGMVLVAGLADAWHILDVAVHPSRRREGIASGLLGILFARTVDDAARAYTLEVRPSNVGAVALYEAHGFMTSGRRPRYYLNGEDALVMWRPPQAVVDARGRGESAAWEPPT